MADMFPAMFGMPAPKLPVILATRFGDNARSFLSDHGPVASDHQWELVKVPGYETEFHDHPVSINLFDHCKDKFKMVIVDLGNKLYLQDKFKDSMHGYLESTGLRVRARGVPLVIAADRETLNESGIWKRSREFAAFTVEKPLALPELEHIVCGSLKIPAGRPRLRVANVTDDFINYLRDYGRKAASRFSLAFPKGQRVVVKSAEPFAVTYDDNATFSAPTMRWLDLEPVAPTTACQLHLNAREWLHQYNAVATFPLKAKFYVDPKK